MDATLNHAFLKYRRARSHRERDNAYLTIEAICLPGIDDFIHHTAHLRCPIEDMRQAARLGILRALDTWRADGGRTLAQHIRFEMKMSIRKLQEEQWCLIRRPAHIQKSYREIANVRLNLFATLNREPTDAEVLSVAPDPHVRARWGFALRTPRTSVCTDVGLEMPHRQESQVDDELYFEAIVSKLLDGLSLRQRQVMFACLMQDAHNPVEISNLCGVSIKSASNLLYISRGTVRRKIAIVAPDLFQRAERLGGRLSGRRSKPS